MGHITAITAWCIIPFSLGFLAPLGIGSLVRQDNAHQLPQLDVSGLEVLTCVDAVGSDPGPTT